MLKPSIVAAAKPKLATNGLQSISSYIFSISISLASTNRITTSDGITCESTSDSPYELESYVEGANNDYNGDSAEDGFDNNKDNTTTVGVRFIYKFGAQKSLNCNKLYNLELRAKEAKVKELEEKIKALESANSINWDTTNEK